MSTTHNLDNIIIALDKEVPKSSEDLAQKIRHLSSGFKIGPPKKADLLTSYHDLLKDGRILANPSLENILKKRYVRTISGVAPITVLTKPFHCPGKCAFCPTEYKMPKSYLSNEPAVMRAIISKWDPYAQVTNRLKALQDNGHDTDKCELIVIGGTWSYLPKKYQTSYIKSLFDGLNGFRSRNLKEAQKFNETTKNRAVGLCLETRPDYITVAEIKRMRELGCTRVEIGLQTTDDKVLKLNKRGHNTATVVRATKLLKDAGFKISYHTMPNLPGATPESDIQTYKDLFHGPDLQPDMVKIYPCVVVKSAEIYQWWLDGKFVPYSVEQLFTTLVELKKEIPPYCRVTRLIRDIPTTSVFGGNMISNLRESVLNELKKQGHPCPCLRCREPKTDLSQIDSAQLTIREYEASGGKEVFLSLEPPDQSKVYAFCRLRLNTNPHPGIIKALPELNGAAIIRELHTYGQMAPIESKDGGVVQHRGFGKKLMSEAERIAKENGFKKLAIISGIGVREYYKKIGYKLEGTYMVKDL